MSTVLGGAGCAAPRPLLSSDELLEGAEGRAMLAELGAGEMAEVQGDLEAAEAAYLAVLARAPAHVEANHRLAVVYDRAGRHAEAERQYRRALAAAERDPAAGAAMIAEIQSDLGFSYLVQERLADAERHLQASIARDGANRRAWHNLALVLGAEGRVAERDVALRRAGASPPAPAQLAGAQAAPFRPAWECTAPVALTGHGGASQPSADVLPSSLPLPRSEPYAAGAPSRIMEDYRRAAMLGLRADVAALR